MKRTSDDIDTFFSRDIKRREFLAICAAGTLPVLFSACQTGSGTQTNATPTPRPTSAPTQAPTVQPSPSDSDWSALAQSLQGTLVRPGSSQYTVARQLFSPRFDNVSPQGIAYCASPADVQQCINFARKFNLPLAPRGGGHSYAGYSTTTGLLVDVTRMNAINVNTSAGTAIVGAGARLIDVYAALAQYNLVIPAGSCPTVGVAGLTLGGGVGVIGRQFGLTCDNLLSAQVVLADGSVLTCNASNNADLFWALRGGGGGNFGVVTSFTFQTHQITAMSLFTIRWAWSNAAEVVNAWQNWAPQAPDALWSNCLLESPGDKSVSPFAQVNGVYVGDVSALRPLLQQLLNNISAAPTSNYSSNAGLLDTMMAEAGCYGKSVAQCHLPTQNSQGQLQRDLSSVKSDYFTQKLPAPGINVLVNAITTRHASSVLGEGGIGMDAYGGAINRVAPDATAFVHRNALFSAQFSASWNASDSTSVVSANRAWLMNTWQGMSQYASGFAYQNYIDPDLTTWQQAYYGSNLARLQHIKATYDPKNLFHFAQSIPPAS